MVINQTLLPITINPKEQILMPLIQKDLLGELNRRL
jgi:hypothetical protein